MRKNLTKTILFLSLVIAIGAGCTPERRVVTSLLKNEDKIPILIIEPDFLFKSNHSAQYVYKGYDSLDDKTKDSIQITESKYIKQLNNKKVLANFNGRMLRELSKYPKIQIYNSSNMPEFLAKGEKGYIFNFSQVQVEEYISLFRDSTYYNGRKYIQDFDRNSFTMNFWVEITETNNPAEKMKIAFTSVHAYDKISGYFSYDLFSGDVRYNYSMDELKINKILGMMDYAATKNARLIFNHILNDKMQDEIIPNSAQSIYFHYDLEHKRPIRVYGNKFKYHFLD